MDNKISVFPLLRPALLAGFILLAALPLFAACGKRIPASAQVQASPVATPAPVRIAIPTPEPETDTAAAAAVVPTPEPTPFTVIWMSDTQHIVEHHADVYNCMTQWIVDNREARNIVYVVHTGDIVNTSRMEYQWEIADDALAILEEAGIPVFTVAGNHDVGASKRNYTRYIESRMPKSPQMVKYAEGKGGYALFSAGGCDFLLLGMGCYSIREEAAVQFMNDTLQRLPDRIAILMTHSYMHKNGNRGGEGPLYFSKVVEPNPNVLLVLAGHMRGVGRRADALDDDGDGLPDRTVHQMLANYQDVRSKMGYFRILTFDPVRRSIDVKTYNPFLDDYNFFADDAEEFVLEDAF